MGPAAVGLLLCCSTEAAATVAADGSTDKSELLTIASISRFRSENSLVTAWVMCSCCWLGAPAVLADALMGRSCSVLQLLRSQQKH